MLHFGVVRQVSHIDVLRLDTLVELVEIAGPADGRNLLLDRCDFLSQLRIASFDHIQRCCHFTDVLFHGILQSLKANVTLAISIDYQLALDEFIQLEALL